MKNNKWNTHRSSRFIVATEEGRQRRKKRCYNDFCCEKRTKNGFHGTLPRSFKMFINVFAFVYVKANPKEICEETSFPSLLQENADGSIFVEIQG